MQFEAEKYWMKSKSFVLTIRIKNNSFYESERLLNSQPKNWNNSKKMSEVYASVEHIKY